SQRNGQRERFAPAVFPMDEIAAARVRKRVIGRTIGCVAPHPDQMETSIGAEHGVERIGIAPTLAVEERRGEQPSPRTGGGIVGVVEIAAIATASVALTEKQIPGGVFGEDWARSEVVA